MIAETAFDQVTTIDLDIGKNTFHLVGLDKARRNRWHGLGALRMAGRDEVESIRVSCGPQSGFICIFPLSTLT
jgi:hypothetical protein